MTTQNIYIWTCRNTVPIRNKPRQVEMLLKLINHFSFAFFIHILQTHSFSTDIQMLSKFLLLLFPAHTHTHTHTQKDTIQSFGEFDHWKKCIYPNTQFTSK